MEKIQKIDFIKQLFGFLKETTNKLNQMKNSSLISKKVFKSS
jgi:hypothetical protein